MNTSIWRFRPNVPVHFQLQLQPLLEKVERLVPSWIQYINVVIETDMKDPAQIIPRYDYRRAWLTIGMAFFTEPQVQLEVLTHELMHLYQEPLWNHYYDLRTKLTEDYPDMENLWIEQGRHVREQLTCDMTALVYDLLMNK